MKTTLCLLGLAALCGCATIDATDKATSKTPSFYAGARLDIAALARDENTLDLYAAAGIRPPLRPALDLPFSLALDTLLFVPTLLCGGLTGWCMAGAGVDAP